MYYLQSRYYDPNTGRFINADAYGSTGQGIIGCNMFAYCGNNPVSRSDSTGFSWVGFWKDVEEWFEDKKEEASSNKNVTTTAGGTASGAFGIGGSISLGVTKDTKGNVGLAFTLNGGGGFPSVGVGGYVSLNNAPTIYHQEGWGTVIGASGGPGVIAAGGEYNMLIDADNGCTYHGGTFSITYGLYPTVVEVHGEVGYTWVWGFNAYDVLIDMAEFMQQLGKR